MKYETWLTYPNMSLAVELKNNEYHCCEFGVNQTKKLNIKICTSILELKFYLLSIPNPPKKQISVLIKKLEII
tara:strand:+ start:585 stop:803 length:219 start_codon:yes stop_codon:yes gene_type:complete